MNNFKCPLALPIDGNYQETMDVYLDDLNHSIGKCKVLKVGDVTIGSFTLDQDVEGDMYLYYRQRTEDNFVWAIQLLPNVLPNKPAQTINEYMGR